jgi:hypothetical protein
MVDCVMPIAESAKVQPSRDHFSLLLATEEKSGRGFLRALSLRAAFLSLLVYCGYSAAIVITASARLLGNQWENTYPEAPHIFAAIRSAQTGHLYFPFTQPPYVLQSYGPLFYEMYYWMARAVRADTDRFIHLARVTDFSCFLLCGVLIFLICRRLAFTALTCAAAAALPLGVPMFCNDAATTRPDMYFLAIMLASLLVAVWDERPDKWVCIASGAIGAISFLLKQPGIAVLAAVVGVWLFRRRFRDTACFAAGAAVPIVLMFAFLLWRKEDFLGQFLSVGLAIRSLSGGVAYTYALLKAPTLLLPIAIGALGFGRALAGGTRAQLLAWFALINWIVGLSGMPQLGSAGNYFFGGLLGCGLLLPFSFELVRKTARFAAIPLLIAAGLCYLSITYTVEGAVSASNSTPSAYGGLESFRILSDRPEFSLHGRDPDLLDPISVHMVELGSGEWTSAPVEQNVRSLSYDLIILACSGGSRVICNFRGVNFFSLGVIGAINQNYCVFCTSQNAIVLVPRSRHIRVTPGMLDPALGGSCSVQYQGHAPDLLVLDGTR